MGHLLIHLLGLDNVSGRAYAFWSGFGSDVTEFGMMAGLLGLFRKHNCHQAWCPRIGHHPWADSATGLTYQLCRKHHPDHPGSALRMAPRARTGGQLSDG